MPSNCASASCSFSSAPTCCAPWYTEARAIAHDHTAVAPHSHADVWLVARPLLVGMVHGLAGSAPLLLLTLTVMSSPLAAFSYIAVFGVGSMMGMTIMSLLVSVPARLTVGSSRAPTWHCAVSLDCSASGLASSSCMRTAC